MFGDCSVSDSSMVASAVASVFSFKVSLSVSCVVRVLLLLHEKRKRHRNREIIGMYFFLFI